MDELHVLDVGEGPVLVLLHAFPCDGSMWLPQATALAADGWRVLVPDLPGFGSSTLPDAAPGLDVVADAVLGLLDRRGIDRAVVGGVSLGGYVTMALLRSRPELVAAAILCDTKATADATAARENRERLAWAVTETPAECGRVLEEAVLPGLVGDTTRAERPEVVDRVRGWLHQAPPATVAWYQRAMAARPDSIPVLEASTASTLIVWGDEDTLSPRAEQDIMLSALVDGDLVVVPRAGHLSNVEAPDAVTAALRRFLAVVRSSRDL